MVPYPGGRSERCRAASARMEAARGRISSMLDARIARYVNDPATGDFDELAMEAFAFQFERIRSFRRLCEKQGVVPGRIEHWTEIPLIPALAFKTTELASAPARETFRSSGTSGGRRSVHRHGFPDLYRATIDVSFPTSCLGPLASPPMLSLIPDRRQAPDSSLSFMIDRVVTRHGAPESLTALGPGGLEAARARSFLAARQRDGRATLILATAFALISLLEALERLDLRFRLPAGSVVFETGGYKGRTREISRQELLDRLSSRLGIPAAAVVREYGMTELTSQIYTRALVGGDSDLFIPPHWVRVRILDTESLVEQSPGENGLIAIFDLANLSSAVHLLTEDLGSADGEGFRLTGRAAGAELRGCSLTAEELSRA
jgi:hypothetical protein